MHDVASTTLGKEVCSDLVEHITNFRFMPGGRYIYYAGREARFWNNCYLLKGEEDTRQEWAKIVSDSMSCLTTGGGIGIDYSVFRGAGAPLKRTGGKASGPIPLMYAVNEIGRNVMQGGSRRSAIYASLNWQHPDAKEFLHVKDWHEHIIGPDGYTHWDGKQWDFNHKAPLDMTNISLNYDDAWLSNPKHPTYIANVRQALMTGEPGFSFNFGDKQDETLRNACTEVTSRDDGDVCNLGSANMGACRSLAEFSEVVQLGTMFLMCGTLGAQLPYEKIYRTREKNRRLGLGIMGVHEWFLQRKLKYDESNPEFQEWMKVYRDVSDKTAYYMAQVMSISNPVARRAIAPTGTIGILAATTTGIEPLFAVAYKRRYLLNGTDWKYEYVIDNTAKQMIDMYGVDPDSIESAIDFSYNPERRIKFQAGVQDYVDMAISSTINLPAWGSDMNNEDRVEEFADILIKYAPRLRGFTCYPDGSRGGQPLTSVPYAEAVGKEGIVYEDNDSCKGGICGL